MECRDEGWRSINAEDLKSFFDKHHSEGKAGTATEIDDAGAARQRLCPRSYFFYADCIGSSIAIAAVSEEFVGDCLISVRTIHSPMVSRGQFEGAERLKGG